MCILFYLFYSLIPQRYNDLKIISQLVVYAHTRPLFVTGTPAKKLPTKTKRRVLVTLNIMKRINPSRIFSHRWVAILTLWVINEAVNWTRKFVG